MSGHNLARTLLESERTGDWFASLTADDSDNELNMISEHTRTVNVIGVTNGVTDFVTLPPIANVPIGHTVTIANNSGGNCELRTPATSGTTINGVDSDGTQEYLLTTVTVAFITKVTTTGWLGFTIIADGTVTSVTPDA